MGYDASRFVDLPCLIEEELSCHICCGIFQKPVITPCGHAFCKECLVTWFNQEKTCPLCRKLVDKICKPPIIVTNILARLNIKCNFTDRGCITVTPLDSIEKHEATCVHRKKGFFSNFINKVLPSFKLSSSSHANRISEYDVETEEYEEDDEVHLMDANMNVGQVFPYFLQAVTLAGIFYNCYNLLNGV